jgi:hypothetical protein
MSDIRKKSFLKIIILAFIRQTISGVRWESRGKILKEIRVGRGRHSTRKIERSADKDMFERRDSAG